MWWWDWIFLFVNKKLIVIFFVCLVIKLEGMWGGLMDIVY